ncbi:MAG TPA: tRNA lysidine(34) synthetase TilS, partial [Bacteroidia bacterium]|nr:tRNA lysidine(34) synthetase TilS [Bacteroidia bacterium]
MLQEFQQFISEKKLFEPSQKILLAISGGIDSVAMAELFYRSKINFSIAHCNFKLRGKESEADEKFVQKLAEKYKVSFFTKSFDTKKYALKNKISIQMAARELRYHWFSEIIIKEKFAAVSIAHHKSDEVETLLINLLRGTGIAGLHGILPKNGKIIRPLLFATRSEIEAFAKKNKIKFREDSSNKSDKYIRNKIRHTIIPILKEINPAAENSIAESIEKISETEIIFQKHIAQIKKKVRIEKEGIVSFRLTELKKENPLKIIVFELLKEFNFNSETVNEIIDSFSASSGKTFFSSTHRLLKDRETLIVEPISKEKNKTIKTFISISKNKKSYQSENINLSFSKIPNRKSNIQNPSNIACLDYDLLQFPLQLRKWKSGDYFYPLGMKSKKKLSDYFIDKKISISQKEKSYVLL